MRFEPIYQYRLWGGRRLAGLLTAPLPGAGPIGETWVLSGRDDHPSHQVEHNGSTYPVARGIALPVAGS
jgi:mannose-6-phosphate isomerase class I